MIWLSSDDRKLLDRFESEVSAEEMEKNWKNIMEFSKNPPYMIAGSPEEEAAVQYMKKTLEEYGVSVKILRFPGYISTPISSNLKMISPREMDFQCCPDRTAGSTPLEGKEAELIYIELENLGKVECKDKIVLTDEGAVENKKIMDKLAAEGIVSISRDTFMQTVIHHGSNFYISGNPTSDNYHLIPNIPAVKVSYADGQMLKSFCMEGPVRVNMKSFRECGWKILPLLVAEIKGIKDPDKFVLVNGHVDTNFAPGVTDNASGCVAMMEIARVFNKHKDKLTRSVKICFWSGHETGRYAGSTWYNDEYWHDLRYNCVAFLGVDSPGVKGATEYTARGVSTSPELWETVKKGISYATGKTCESYRWPGRSGDCSFWGTGFPAIWLCATLPEEELDPYVGFSGMGWWWHSPWSTLDRGDKNDLASNVKVYFDIVFTLCNSPILPMNFVDMADKMLEILIDLQNKADKIRAHFNIDSVIDRAKEFKKLAEDLEELNKNIISKYEKATNKEAFESILKEINHCIMWVSRHLNLVAAWDAEKTKQISPDNFRGKLAFPGLRPILELAEMPLPYPGQVPDFGFLRTKLVRERNKAEDGFVLAIDQIKRTIDKVTARAKG